MVVFFINRLYAKLFKIRKYSWDDRNRYVLRSLSFS